jgi:hypothetical protein
VVAAGATRHRRLLTGPRCRRCSSPLSVRPEPGGRPEARRSRARRSADGRSDAHPREAPSQPATGRRPRAPTPAPTPPPTPARLRRPLRRRSPRPSRSRRRCGSASWSRSTLFSRSTRAAGAVDATWDFGDGATSTSWNPQHDYAAPGQYTVTLTAVNGAGVSAHRSHVVTIGN